MSRPTQPRTVTLAMGLLAVTLALALAGCGKKPPRVSAPEGTVDDRFPQVYPNPNLDPKPGQPSSGAKFP